MAIDKQALIEAARDVSRNAHARFSNYFVGAAVQDETGAVHVGCNVENASYPEGICAEANAIGSMVASGARRIAAIAVVGGVEAADTLAIAGGVGEVSACTPCGGCRQRILEFADDDTLVITLDSDGNIESHGIDQLLPRSFRVD